MTTKPNTSLIACHDCDLLVEAMAIDHGQQICCPRCGAELPTHSNASAVGNELAMATALAGLILFIPAVSLPLLGFELAGQHGSNTLLEGIVQLWKADYALLSLLVLLCSFIAPLAQLLLTASTCFAMQRGALPRTFASQVKAVQFFQHWSMLEVYTISILVAYIKMLSDGEVEILLGSYCLAGLLINLIVAARYFNSALAWQYWDERHRDNRNSLPGIQTATSSSSGSYE